MKYSVTANTVNIGFMALFFFAPIAIALHNTGLPKEEGRFLILLAFILVTLALTDWYFMYFSNSFSGIIFYFLSFSALALCAVIITMFLSNQGFIDLALFNKSGAWDGYRVLLRFYVVGFGVALIALLSIPRLLFLRLLCDTPLPGENNGI